MKSIIFLLMLGLCSHVMARGGERSFKLLSKLDLSEEQIKKIEEYKLKHPKMKKTMRGERKAGREKMKKLFLEGQSDQELRKLHEELAFKTKTKAEKRLEKMIFIKNLLNKEQREIYIKKKDDSRKRGKRAYRKH